MPRAYGHGWGGVAQWGYGGGTIKVDMENDSAVLGVINTTTIQAMPRTASRAADDEVSVKIRGLYMEWIICFV